MLIVIGKDGLTKALSQLSGEDDLLDTLRTLRQSISSLEIEKGRKQEEFDRRERETEHKVGLERKRSEFEASAAKREATLSVREENLAADRKRFEEQMTFHDKRFTEEVGYLKSLIESLAERLPSLEMTADVGKRRGGK